MKNYTYRTTLTKRENADPLLAAAFAVAQRAHAGQMRGKINDVPYLTHPLMVLDILYAMGVRDSTVLAAALLHDVLEDYPPYAGPKDTLTNYYFRMHDDLMVALSARIGQRMNPNDPHDQRVLTPGIADEAASRIFQLVQEVTKPKVYDEDLKLIAQLEHMKQASLDGKQLKIADQIASLMCRLHKRDDPKKFSREKQREFTNKATNLVQAILESARDEHEKMTLSPWDRLFTWVSYFSYQLDQKETVHERKILRRDLDFKTFFDKDLLESKGSVQVASTKIVGHYFCDEMEYEGGLPAHGAILRRVDFDKEGRVTSCVLSRGTSPGHPGYALRDRWMRNIDKQDRRNQQSPHSIKIENIIQVRAGAIEEGRLFRLMPPMPVAVFGAACRDVICTNNYIWGMIHKSEQIEHDCDMLNVRSGVRNDWRVTEMQRRESSAPLEKK